MVNRIRRNMILAGSMAPFVPSIAIGASNIISAENSLAGANDWRIQKWATFFDWSARAYSTTAPYPEVEGYCSAHSVNIGESIKFFVNCKEPTFTLKIYRLGWYGGNGSRLMMTQSLAGQRQTIPAPDALGTVDCKWTESFSLNVPTNWVSGMYFAKLIAGTSGTESLIAFVVRDDARASDYVFASAFNTSQAYNNWGGKSLYEFNSFNSARANAISFNRPDQDGAGCGQVMHWELSMIRFLEREGYDVKYIANYDVHTNGGNLSTSKVFLSVGHDEYWSYEMKQAVMNAQAAGMSTAFLSANTCYWQVRLNGRIMTSYKEKSAQDPYVNLDRTRITSQWRQLAPVYGVNDPVCRAENGMIGVQYHGDPVDGDLIVFDPSHWIFQGTGVIAGTRFPGLLGYETDTMFNNGLQPAGLQKVFESPDPFGYSHGTCATLPSGSIVFASGTIQWSWGVDFTPSWAPNSGTDRTNATFRQINRNLLTGLLAAAGGGGVITPPPKTAQTITFPPIPNHQLGDSAFTISATASSGLPVTFSSQTPSVATVSGNTVTVIGAGTAIIAANQSGNDTYDAAPQVTQSFQVASTTTPPQTKTAQTIDFSAITETHVVGEKIALTATASSGLPVVFKSLTPSTATVSGNVVTVIKQGTVTIAANQAGNDTYTPAPQVTRSFTARRK